MSDSPPTHGVVLRVRSSAIELERAGVTSAVAGRRGLLLTTLVVLGPMARARLAGLLWPDAAPQSARANLRQTIRRLRLDGIAVDGDPLRLPTDLRAETGTSLAARREDAPPAVDAAPAGRTAEVTTDLASERASDAYEDPYAVPETDDLPELADLLTAAQERRRALDAIDAARSWEEAIEAGRGRDAVHAARSWLAIDPRSADAHIALMRSHEASRDPGATLDAFRRMRVWLRRSLEAGPPDEAVEIARRAAETAAATGLSAATPSTPRSAGFVRRAEAEGWLAEGVALLREAADRTTDPVARGRRRIGQAWLEHQLGRNDAAERSARAGLRDVGGDPASRREGWFVLGSVERHRGRPDAARAAWRRALDGLPGGRLGGPERMETDGRTWGRAGSEDGAEDVTNARDAAGVTLLLNLALVEDALGDAAAAGPRYVAALEAARAAHDVRSEAIVLNNLAHVALDTGRVDDATVLLARAASLAAAGADRQLRGYVADGMARVRLAAGDADGARGWAARAAEEGDRLGDAVLAIEGLASLAEALAALGQEPSAAKVRAEAERRSRTVGYGPGLARLLGPSTAVTPPSRPARHDSGRREGHHGEDPEVP